MAKPIPAFFLLLFCSLARLYAQQAGARPGAERMAQYLPLLQNKQIGLVVNATSRVGDSHLVDTLCALGYCVSRIFAPEHGLRGQAEAGETIKDAVDVRTGIPVISLYGRKKKPAPEDFSGVDFVVFDMQDVGARFYTYISTLFYVMEACAEQEVPLLVLDRPNPNGHYVDGPVLDTRLESFVGIAPLPIVHGCTLGELARLFAGEGWINLGRRLSLRVIPCLNYTHQTVYAPPVRPSPNLPNLRAILLYPGLCLFEGTAVSVGRGTDLPFQVLGYPEFPKDSFTFVPRANAGARYPLYAGELCKGLDLSHLSIDSLFREKKLQLGWLLYFYQMAPDKKTFFNSNGFFDLLAGTRALRTQIEAGKTEAEIRESWREDLEAFRQIRKRYLLYGDE